MWKSRNVIQFNREERCSGKAVNKAIQEWLEYKNVGTENGINKETREGKAMEGGRWTPPPKGYIMMNTDVGLNTQTGRVGWGIVARKEDGGSIGARVASESKLCEPPVEEALVIK